MWFLFRLIQLYSFLRELNHITPLDTARLPRNTNEVNRNRIIILAYLIIIGGMFAFKEFFVGDTYRAVLTILSFLLFGALVFFYDELQSWMKPFVLILPLIVLSASVYQDFKEGNVPFAILGTAMIAGGALICLQSQPIAVIKAMFLINLGGLFAYKQFFDGTIESTIRMSILFAFFFVLFFYESAPAWIRPFVMMLPINLLGLSAYRDFRFGNMSYVTLDIVLIVGGALMLVQDTPLVKEKSRPTFSLIPLIAFSVFLIWDLLLLP